MANIAETVSTNYI